MESGSAILGRAAGHDDVVLGEEVASTLAIAKPMPEFAPVERGHFSMESGILLKARVS